MSDTLERVSIGFDLRNSTASADGDSREDQLLSCSSGLVISADPNVLRRREDVDRVISENAETLCNPLELATHLDALLGRCQTGGVAIEGQLLLCITTSEANVVALVERFGPGWFELQPFEKELEAAGWQLRGFDVIDLRGLISGLSGCGFSVSAKQLLKNLFEPGLNEFGLFRSYSLAQQFAEVRGLEIPEHAPLIAVGVLIRAA